MKPATRPYAKRFTSFVDWEHFISINAFKQYGTQGTESREAYKAAFEAFRPGVMLYELRKETGLTQEQLAKKCGTMKSYISRIENSDSDIQLGTLIRIFKQGVGKDLKLLVN